MDPDPPPSSIPLAILSDNDPTNYFVCWEPDAGGVITHEPSHIAKFEVCARWPSVVRAWEGKQADKQADAQRTERKFRGLLKKLVTDPKDDVATNTHKDEGIVEILCDQRLLPGTMRHWGEVRVCRVHPEEKGKAPMVCMSCCVGHYMQVDGIGGFDRHLIMEKGARVPLCDECGAMFLREGGAERTECVCDRKWSCFDCREAELKKLATARRASRYHEGTCGECFQVMDPPYGQVELCFRCGGARIAPPFR